ncbi:MAG: sulfotransferase family protein, partial [Gammaproteobacteria bacterium]
ELGLTCLEAGRAGRAAACFRRALSLERTYPGVSLNLARSKRFEAADDPDLVLIRGLLGAKKPVFGQMSAEHRADVNFALAKCEEDLGRYERAFTHYAEANSLIHASLPAWGEAFDREQFAAGVDKLIAVFDQSLFDRLHRPHDDEFEGSERSVLIVGMPRSGTSLVEQILASHPDVYGAGELSLLDSLSRKVRALVRADSNYPLCVRAIDRNTVVSLGADYVRELVDIAPYAARVADKMPSNFLHLGLAALIAPRASLVHVERDAMDTCWSIYATQFGTGHEWAYDFDDIVFYYGEYRRLMAHWAEVLPAPVLALRYEDLVNEQEQRSRALVAHCGLDWDERCLDFHNTERRVSTASEWQVRQPMYKSSIARWRRYEDQLQPLQQALARHVRVGAGEPAER